ncbi:efflux RND transporter periplasmic adaptor subunit [Vibrio rumoiensis]|uniref:Efflux transporter periplasmic adaptor subunit n=1 Tax=Vibrio rumoiensis 1S-45 TaxID=1188252 RepID=A0A1E5DYN0_9VIBR|nr:efflux RND transporter periplasmic adaptor subunit [Vibrio rumoiensis]OEF22670.1 efflux transporter periplasmic adaptor subunit [Vibrio rumoiensis 1S-45]
MNKKISRTLGLAFTIFVSSYHLANAATPKKPTSIPSVPVGAQIVEMHDVQQSLTLVAKLVAQESVLIKPEVSGRVEKILVQSNQEIKAGQPLITLDSTKAKATLNEARAYYNDERRKEREYASLVKKNAITQTELDAQRASVDIAKARFDVATADLAYLTLKAPFAGTIGFIDFSKGKTVTDNEELFTLDNLESMRLDLQVPEKYLSQISVGMTVNTVSRAWGDQPFQGKVTNINTRVNNATLSVPVRIDIPNPDHKLKPGMLMSATIHFPEIHKPIIPVQALEYSGTKRFVYVIEDNKVIRTEITLGARIEDKIVVETGLNIGQKIVTKGLVNMRDGLKVNIVEDNKLELNKAVEQGAK